jgi:SulP family sulfate permease
LIPLSALAAILIMVAWNMSEIGHFIHLLKAPIGDVAVLLISFFLTVFVDITVAIFFGMILSSFLFMKRMSQLSKTVPLTEIFQESKDESQERKDIESLSRKKIPLGVEIYEIQGPFFFGAADILKDLLANFERPPKIFILRMRHVGFMDASGMLALKEFHQKCLKEKTLLFLSEIQAPAEKDLIKFGLAKAIGKEQFFSKFDDALDESHRQIDEENKKLES